MSLLSLLMEEEEEDRIEVYAYLYRTSHRVYLSLHAENENGASHQIREAYRDRAWQIQIELACGTSYLYLYT